MSDDWTWAPSDGPDAAAYKQLRDGAVGNDTALIEQAMQSQIDIDALYSDQEGLGTTALVEAASRNNVDAIRCLLARGAQVDARRYDDRNQFDDNTPLYEAARSAHAEAAQELLQAGADSRATGEAGEPAFAAVLSEACHYIDLGVKQSITAQRINTAKVFVQHSLKTNQQDGALDAIAEQAATVGNDDLLKWLHEMGASNKSST